MTNRLALTSFAILLFSTGCNLFNGDDGQCEFDNLEERCKDASFFRIDQEPAWSPDGETIAFYRGGTNPEEAGIYLINPDGENLRQFHAGGGNAPSWSPDGKWIAFHQGAQIYKKLVESDSLVQLTFEDRNFHPSWGLSGKFIAYTKSIGENRGLWIMNNKGGELKFLEFIGAYPDWHPNIEEKILYLKNKSEDGFTLGNEIWEVDIKTEEKTFLSFLSDENHFDTRYLQYSPNGQLTVITSQPRGGGYPQIWKLDLISQEKEQLTENGGWAADWSPDGDWIVYTETFETGRLWLMRPDGSEKQQLTFE